MRYSLKLGRRWFKHSFSMLIEQISLVSNFHILAVIRLWEALVPQGTKAFLQWHPSVQHTTNCSYRAEHHSVNFSMYSTGEFIQLWDYITLIFQRHLMRTALEKAIKLFSIFTIEKESPIPPSLIHYQPVFTPKQAHFEFQSCNFHKWAHVQ